jgi:hypothetical protein
MFCNIRYKYNYISNYIFITGFELEGNLHFIENMSSSYVGLLFPDSSEGEGDVNSFRWPPHNPETTNQQQFTLIIGIPTFPNSSLAPPKNEK